MSSRKPYFMGLLENLFLTCVRAILVEFYGKVYGSGNSSWTEAALRLLLCTLALIIPCFASCQKLKNDSHRIQIDCGSDARIGTLYSKLVDAEGQDIQTAGLVAYTWDPQSGQLSSQELPMTQYHCLVKTSDIVLIRSRQSAEHLAYLGPLLSDKTKMSAENQNIGLGCREEVAVRETYHPELNFSGDYGIQGFRIALEVDGMTNAPVFDRIALSFDLSTLPEGESSIAITAENLFTQEQQRKLCKVHVDRTAPVLTIDRDQLLTDPLRVKPIQPIAITSNEPSDIYYCLTNGADEAACEYTRMKGDHILTPPSGSWQLHSYAVDTAGNRSVKQSLPFSIYNQTQIENIESQLALARFADAAAAHIDAAHHVLKAHNLRDRLQTTTERESVDAALTHAYWQLGENLHAIQEIKVGFDAFVIDVCKSRVALYLPNGKIQIMSSRGVFERELQATEYPFANPGQIKWSRDCQYLVSAAPKGTVLLWGPDGRATTLQEDPFYYPRRIAISDDNNLIALSGFKLQVYSRSGVKKYDELSIPPDNLQFVPGSQQLIGSNANSVQLLDFEQNQKAFSSVVRSTIANISYVLPLAKGAFAYVEGSAIYLKREGFVDKKYVVQDMSPRSLRYFDPVALEIPDDPVLGPPQPALYVTVGGNNIRRCALEDSSCNFFRSDSGSFVLSGYEMAVSVGNKINFTNLFHRGSSAWGWHSVQMPFSVETLDATADTVVASGYGQILFIARPAAFHFFESFFVPFDNMRLSKDRQLFWTWNSQQIMFAPADAGLSQMGTLSLNDEAEGYPEEVYYENSTFYCLFNNYQNGKRLQACQKSAKGSGLLDVFKKGADRQSFLAIRDKEWQVYTFEDLQRPQLTRAMPDNAAAWKVEATRSYLLLENSEGFFIKPVNKDEYRLDLEAESLVYLFDGFLVASEPSRPGISIIQVDNGTIVRYPKLNLSLTLLNSDGTGRFAVFGDSENSQKIHVFEGQREVFSVLTTLSRKYLPFGLLRSGYLALYTHEGLSELHELASGKRILQWPSSPLMADFLVTTSGILLLADRDYPYSNQQHLLKLDFDKDKLRKNLCQFIQANLKTEEKAELCP